MLCNTTCELGVNLVSSFFYLFVLFLFILRITVWIRELVLRVKLSRSGVKVDGHITDHRSTKSAGRERYNYYLTYDYDYNGSTYHGKQKVDWDGYLTLNDGAKVSVSCLPENPKNARLGDKIPDSLVGKGRAVALILLGVAGVIIMLAIASSIVYEGFRHVQALYFIK